jgi:hypothetical protein
MATLVTTPFPVFTDTDGLPLEGGYINIGVAGLNPLSNPLQVYWDQALTIPATNIRTTRGYPSRNGAAGFLYAPPGDFSILVRNKNGVVILSNLNIVDTLTVVQNDLLTKADIDSPALTGTPTAPTAAVETATTQLATTEFVIQNSHVIGELVMSEFAETPSVGFPALPRNVNQDITTANWPLLVNKARSKSISVLGVTDHAVNVAANVITFGVAAATTALLNLIIQDAVVTNYINGGEIANFLGGATYAVAAAQRTVTISAVDYTITAVDAVARTITVSVNPPAGAQTLTVFPYRIAGAANSARFLRIAGFVGVAAGDAEGEIIGGFRKMDRGQQHWHTQFRSSAEFAQAWSAGVQLAALSQDTATNSVQSAGQGTIKTQRTDTVNGTPRTGKTTDPRTAGQYAYTWGGQYIP